jgi:hypothetical protein
VVHGGLLRGILKQAGAELCQAQGELGYSARSPSITFNPTSHWVKEDPQSQGGGGGYYNHGLKQIFPGRFLAVSLHISILLYIRTSHSRGNVSSFKTLDLGAFQKSDPKAQKSSASKSIKEKRKKMIGPLLFRGPPNEL